MITVVQAGPYSFIGEWSEVTKVMASPRVMQPRQVGPTETRLMLTTMIGNPKEITLHTPFASYEPDKEIQDYYRAEVTGIKIVPTGALSSVDGVLAKVKP